MDYNHRGRTIKLVPDDLYSRYTLPILSQNALIWSFSRVNLFFPCFAFRVAGSSATRVLYST